MGIDRSKSGKIVSIEVFRRLAARRSGSLPAPVQSPAPSDLPDENALGEAIERLQESLKGAPRLESPERERLLAKLRADLEKLPDVRSDKVIEAKLRISTGYYDNDEIRREILRSMLESIIPPHLLEKARRDAADDPDRREGSPPETGRDPHESAEDTDGQ